jgi:hypothetical protein
MQVIPRRNEGFSLCYIILFLLLTIHPSNGTSFLCASFACSPDQRIDFFARMTISILKSIPVGFYRVSRNVFEIQLDGLVKKATYSVRSITRRNGILHSLLNLRGGESEVSIVDDAAKDIDARVCNARINQHDSCRAEEAARSLAAVREIITRSGWAALGTEFSHG